jgi:hypothetical protein
VARTAALSSKHGMVKNLSGVNLAFEMRKRTSAVSSWQKLSVSDGTMTHFGSVAKDVEFDLRYILPLWGDTVFQYESGEGWKRSSPVGPSIS